MSGARAKLASFADSRSYCCGSVLDLLADRRCKHYRSLNIEKFLVLAAHIILVIHGIGKDYVHTNVVIVLDKLPRAEIDDSLDSGNSDVSVRRFLERLAVGQVSELPGSLVLELESSPLHVDIVRPKVHHEHRGNHHLSDELILLMVVDALGDCNFFRFDSDLPFSRTHHKWEYIATLDFSQQCKKLPDSTVSVQSFSYCAETGEVVYCSREDSHELGTTPTDEVHMCSLRFKAKCTIEQSRNITVGSFNSVVSVLSSVCGFWIVCADLQITHYRFDTCKCYTLRAAFEASALDPLFRVESNVLSAVYSSDSTRAEQSSLYLCGGHTLLRVSWAAESGLHLSGVHRLQRALCPKSAIDTQTVVLCDMYIAVEQHTTRETTAVVCVASASATFVLHLDYPHSTASAQFQEHIAVRDARLCITLLIPKSRTVHKAICFVPPSATGAQETLLHVCRGRSVYSIATTGLSEQHRKNQEKDRYPFSDLESVLSDADELKQRREQTWISLFQRAKTQPLESSEFFREGDAEVPLTSIHQRTTLREYLHSDRSDVHDADSPQSPFSSHYSQHVTLSKGAKSLLSRIAGGEGNLQSLLVAWSARRRGSPPGDELAVPFTAQTVSTVLEQLAADLADVSQLSSERASHDASVLVTSGADPGGPPPAAAAAAAWIADIDLTTLLPPVDHDHITRLSEFGRTVDPLLVMDLVQSLSPAMSASPEADAAASEKRSPSKALSAALFYDGDLITHDIAQYFVANSDGASSLRPTLFVGDTSSTQTRALSLDVILHLLWSTRPAKYMDVLYCLLEIERRSLHRLEGTPEGPESPLPSLMRNIDVDDGKVLPKVRSFRTSIGSAGEGVPQQVVQSQRHSHHAHQHAARGHHARQTHHAVDDDDDMFGLGLSGAILQAQAQAHSTPSVDISVHLHRNRLLGTRNVSSTVFESDVSGNMSEASSDSGSEDGDGEDMFGIFRDVEDDAESSRQRIGGTSAPDARHPSAASGSMKESSQPITQGMKVWKVRELLFRAVRPLLVDQKDMDIHVQSGSNALAYVPLLDRCEPLAHSTLRGLSAHIDHSSAQHNAQIDSMLRVLLLCHQPVQVAVHLVRLGLYAPLAAFCLRLGASVTLLAAESIDTAAAHPVARYVQAVGGARTSARFSTKQNQSETAKWEALLEELYAVQESNLSDTLTAVLRQAESGGVTPSAAHIRLVEYIVTLKLTLKCLLSRPDGIKDLVGSVLELVQSRPSSVPLETMRAWINAFSSNGADKARMLLSGILGSR